ncbi:MULTISPECIES: imidazolonepropionase [Mesonia]|uniref:Imidazolonepropionase n=1 Tax=Mesonia oceanica TaxID=2687242 RepID=A0AC61YBZ0_9FLAO|nr:MULTISPECIES: imidazolonepropionase [Mesonia]MAN29177.1 imidazolonepropionase [Mesonia sp.]MAQ39999.1 imidazolonepropionase [Mesonia sp.]MBJ99132.1 imidazolonepropionase [Flavobacteriaceae bacterium]VVV01956.1 Imidazolonepropionase [Mesonia oceanica]|tara:strand:+ start:124331 stop:125569 length:1239 start_codon:yes stop_codon:yes gene_type:complete
MKTLIRNIKQLVQVREEGIEKLSGEEMATLPTLSNAWLLINDYKIEGFGGMESIPHIEADVEIDATGKMVLPSWVDSHTHLVYAGNREQEFIDKINGLTYEEIAAKGGGIVNSAKELQQTEEEELFQQSLQRLEQVIKMGTGAIEIKSGYGLTTEAELKMLRVARKLQKRHPITIKTTFLGAHALPKEYKDNKQGYIDLICEEMLPTIAEENLADYIDIFCEQGYFDLKDTEQVLEAGKKYGLRGKIHVNQFNSIGGIKTGVDYHALSVDHLEVMKEEDIEALKGSDTMPVALPSCSLFINIPYSPARKMIDAGLPLALATDYNPGSSPNGNMNLVVSLACIKMGMTPEEAINAATINAAYAMGIQKTHGSITKGKTANLLITDPIPSYGFLPYSFGNNHIDQVILAGRLVK